MKQLLFLLVLFFICSDMFGQQNNDSLQNVIALQKHDDGEMKAYFLLAADCHRTNPEKAKNYLFQAIKYAKIAENYNRWCGANALLLAIYQDEGNTAKAIECLNELKTVAEKDPRNHKTQTNYNQALGLYYRKTGDYKLALSYTLAAAKLAEESGISKTHTAGQWLNAGNVYDELGDYNNSMASNLKALRLFEEVGNDLGVSFCYNNMCAIYVNMKQYGKALGYAQKSLAIKKKLGDKRGICTALQSMGEVYTGLGNKSKAISNYKLAIKIAEDQKMPPEQAILYFNMGKIFAAENKDSIAIVYFKKSQAIANKLDNKSLAAKATMELTSLYKNTDSLKLTEKTLHASLQEFQNSGSRSSEAVNYKRLSELYSNRKQFEKALEYSEKYHAVKDSISGADIQLQLKNLEEQYNSVKKEKEIELLKKDGLLAQAELRQQQTFQYSAIVIFLVLSCAGIFAVNRYRLLQATRRQIEMERVRNQIAADLHDEVGSTLSSIKMYSDIVKNQPHQSETSASLLDKIGSNSKEMIETMSDIVWMIKPGNDAFENVENRMLNFANELCGPHGINLEFDKNATNSALKMPMELRRDLYLIFKESINNAVKYSNCHTIHVAISNLENRIEMRVSDDGIGFDPNAITTGNGLSNMQKRAVAHQGHITVQSSPGKGTEIIAEFPI